MGTSGKFTPADCKEVESRRDKLGRQGVEITYQRVDRDRVLRGSNPRHLHRLHIEDIDTFEFTEELKSLETCGLLFTEMELARFRVRPRQFLKSLVLES